MQANVAMHVTDITNVALSTCVHLTDADVASSSSDECDLLCGNNYCLPMDTIESQTVTTNSSITEAVSDQTEFYACHEEIDAADDCSSNTCDSDLDMDEDNDSDDIRFKLAEWAVECRVPHATLAALLPILRVRYPELPKDPRTLLATPADVVVDDLAGGSYHHIGIESCVLNAVKHHLVDEHLVADRVSIQINIDGLPLFKSSGLQLWPILGLLKEPAVSEPFVIGMFSGKSKPKSVDDFLSQFVSEAKRLETEGFMVLGKKVNLTIHSFICDAPARSFLRKTKSFSGYYACERCIQSGKYVAGRMTFPELSAVKRTDEGFARMIYDEHHLTDTPSPLAQLSLGLVSSFVLDYQHLVCLGVVRRYVINLMRGPLSCRLAARQVAEISVALEELRFNTPSDFSRKPRTLSEIDRWKATEFRQFLLFTSPLVLQNVLPEELYKHFMLLHVAITCLVSSKWCTSMCDYAEKLLRTFVEHGCKIFGPQFPTFNCHSLIHLVDDVRRYGPLDGISCFPFENHLGKLKKAIRKPSLPLQQIINRLSEKQVLGFVKKTRANQSTCPVMKGMHVDDSAASCNAGTKFYSKLSTRGFILSSKVNNSCILLSDGTIARVQHFFQDDNTIFVAVLIFTKATSFYDYPLPSKEIGILCASRLSTTVQVYPWDAVVTKCYCMPIRGNSDRCLVVPMHH